MYIPKDRRKAVDDTSSEVTKLPELTYIITKFLLSMWNSKPVDSTIDILTIELVIDPKNSKFVQNLRSEFADRCSVAQIHAACKMAYDEFYNRVIRLHRALQARENGDILGYTEAIAPLLDELGKEIKKEAVTGLIIPGDKA